MAGEAGNNLHASGIPGPDPIEQADLDPAQVSAQAGELVDELYRIARLRSGDIMVVGCSSSEIMGGRIGHYSSPAIGEAVFAGIRQALADHGVWLAAQCCEHLNRALVIEREGLTSRYGWIDQMIVNAVPQPKAGGSFATAAYQGFSDPVVIEQISADAGLDIGDTLIGMHLRRVAVPVRLKQNHLGHAHVSAARTRAKYIGGPRTHYDENLWRAGE